MRKFLKHPLYMALTLILAIGVYALADSGAVTEGVQNFIGQKTFQFGNGSAQQRTQGAINTQVTAVGTGADTSEDILYTYSLPANSLDVVGRAIRVTVWGSTGATANNKTLKSYFGATVFTSTTSAANAKDWRVTYIITKTGANTQSVEYEASWNAATVQPTVSAGAETDTGAIVIKVSGTNGTAAANDVTGKSFLVEALN